MPAAALLDRNGVYGSQRFSAAAREKGVRPIVGCELTMEDGSVLPVLVKSKAGYANLCSLLTEAHLRSEVKGECAVQWNELPEFAEGLVALLGSAGLQRAGFRHSAEQHLETFAALRAIQTLDGRGRLPRPARWQPALPRTPLITRSA